jgi:phenylacetate-coenzyme A ligase PaaK-like adenylate-forming protein
VILLPEKPVEEAVMEFPFLNRLIENSPYDLRLEQKNSLFLNAVREVSVHHYANCGPYKTFCDKRGFDPHRLSTLEELPLLPTSVFKSMLLLSIPAANVFREINSSATTSGQPSRVGLDRQTSMRQSKLFNKVVLERLGNKRRNFLVLDVPESVKRTNLVTARSSTIRSLLFSAREVDTCINVKNNSLSMDEKKLHVVLNRAQELRDEIVLFGFTYILYNYVVRPLIKKNIHYHLPGAKIIHIGGWKKLESEKIAPEKLIDECASVFGVARKDIVDFYGFTEQSGMIYPTCEEGVRHMQTWGELLVRDPISLKVLPSGREGLLQFITPIQTSYPGHSVLTEDVGVLLGADDCPCGRKGKYFKVLGRAKQAETRGCGDIMAEKFA